MPMPSMPQPHRNAVIIDAPGDGIITASSEEAALASLREYMDNARERLTSASEEQRALDWGGFFYRDTVQPLQGPLRIYCAISTLAAVAMSEDPANMEHILEAHAAGFRYGRHYSVDLPEGEEGSTHVADVVPITEEEFNAAHARGWESDE